MITTSVICIVDCGLRKNKFQNFQKKRISAISFVECGINIFERKDYFPQSKNKKNKALRKILFKPKHEKT